MLPRIHRPGTWVKQPQRSQEDRYREYFENCIKEMEEEEEEEKETPIARIVLYHDLLEKLWGWDRLVPFGHPVSWSEYRRYLETYYRNTKTAAKSSSIVDIADKCCKKEEELVRNFEQIDTKSTILSCLIHQCANSVIQTENCTSSPVSKAALWCMNKEAELMLQLLRHGADPSDSLVTWSSNIRICALGLMNCTLHSSAAAAAAASAAMLGMAKEAEMMCEWMDENGKLLDFCDDTELPRALIDGNIARWQTLDVMYDMLEECVAAGSAKTNGGCKGKKRKHNDDYLANLWGCERLLPCSSFVEWSDYMDYLVEYYIKNAFAFLAELHIEEWLLDPPARAVQIDTTTTISRAAAAAIHCVKMEEKLVSKLKARVPRERSTTTSTIIESRLITERALAICSTKHELCDSSAIVFVCIAMEADLMYELLKHRADPNDNIIEQSRLIRMCALGLLNLKGNLAASAAMVGMAKEAKRVSDWMRCVNKLDKFPKFDLSEPGFSIRTETLKLMKRILCEFSFP